MISQMEEGSMTIEAVLVMAIILLTFMWIMSEAITMYQQAAAIESEWLDLTEIAERFRLMEMGKELLP
ncbi:MAG: hypothetical protein HFI76_07590 [Lachnospiraceae bacterium]|jgi:hypothetical protein|nr:hypothetical protein [Lachnospiraceae bacterium]